MIRTNRGASYLLICLMALTIIICFIAMGTGPFSMSLQEVLKTVCGNGDGYEHSVVWHIRLPRLILAYLVGASLAVSGLVFQGILGNALASPYTLGISWGAAFGAIIGLFCGIVSWMIPFLALICAGITLLLVLLLSWDRRDFLPHNLVLAGIVVGSILSAAISVIKSASGESLTSIVFWIMGSLQSRGWGEVAVVMPYCLVGCIGVLIFSRDLDLLCLGADHAYSLGVDVAHTRTCLIFFASLLAAAAVSVSGVIGFVGLVIPHLLRMILGPSHRRLALFCIPAGGLLLLMADTVARGVAGQAEIPVGAITALLGGPFFCWLLMRRKSLAEGIS